MMPADAQSRMSRRDPADIASRCIQSVSASQPAIAKPSEIAIARFHFMLLPSWDYHARLLFIFMSAAEHCRVWAGQITALIPANAHARYAVNAGIIVGILACFEWTI
jgi:hypothetical protein